MNNIRILEGQSFNEGVFATGSAHKKLALAVIEEAWRCAECYKEGNRAWKECLDSRAFLLGETKSWKESLEWWCELADIPASRLMKQSTKTEWYQDHIRKRELQKKGQLIITADFTQKRSIVNYTVIKDFEFEGTTYIKGSNFSHEDPKVIKDYREKKLIKRKAGSKEMKGKCNGKN